ncbi:hypothetical protein [Kitasatospora cineracea]|uniref:Uncharacterized protein n=1 Tax=Kitasatospora cineracea TaxID=88074 RepID=A0A3N4R9M6_9ACTN|nr:hypothetical protein [Kitasatospora cineracea]RPE27301.1 hypothetical protein EDD38_7446 [Kitasatospora cineracea]
MPRITSTDLRNIADALDALTDTAQHTGVQVAYYSSQYLKLPDPELHLELAWTDATEDTPGHYTVRIEEAQY